MPTLRALECLIGVLDAGSVTVAAERLHMSQPALSHQLAALEREIGTPLLQRLPRGVQPTAAGQAVAGDARAALAASRRVVEVGRAVARGGAGRLRIACAETMTAGVLAPMLRIWLRRNPGVELTLVECTSADALAEAVLRNDADVAVGPRPTRWTGSETTVGSEEVVVVVPPRHELIDSAAITFAGLAEQPVVAYHHQNGLSGWLDTVAAVRGSALTPVVRTRSATTAASLAAAGLGFALVPVSALPQGFSGAVRHLDPPLTRDVVAFHLGDDVLVQAFCDGLRHRGITVPAAVERALSSESPAARD